MIQANQALAVTRQQAKGLRQVQSFPLNLIPGSQGPQQEVELPSVPVVSLPCGTSDRRRRFAFWPIGPSSARRQTALMFVQPLHPALLLVQILVLVQNTSMFCAGAEEP